MDSIKKQNENRDKILQDSAKLITTSVKENTNINNISEVKGSSEKANLTSNTIDKSKINVTSEKNNDKSNMNSMGNSNVNVNSGNNDNNVNLDLKKNEIVYGDSKLTLQDGKKIINTTKEYMPSKEQTVEGLKEGAKMAEKLEKEKSNPLVNKLFGAVKGNNK